MRRGEPGIRGQVARIPFRKGQGRIPQGPRADGRLGKFPLSRDLLPVPHFAQAVRRGIRIGIRNPQETDRRISRLARFPAAPRKRGGSFSGNRIATRKQVANRFPGSRGFSQGPGIRSRGGPAGRGARGPACRFRIVGEGSGRPIWTNLDTSQGSGGSASAHAYSR